MGIKDDNLYLMNSEQSVQVSDTTEGERFTKAGK
jgi:hypothetical protein